MKFFNEEQINYAYNEYEIYYFISVFQLNQLKLTSGTMRIKFHLYLKKAGLASKNRVLIKLNIY